ncbi:MAG: hypothetical protein ACOYI6_05280 [Christensenellales bacterium]|jgi:protein-arginine kinase activator protein McsA|nr:hypothetical protein [Clostridiales bacterium]
MICEVCREKNADIVFKTVTGNQVATKAMCMSCAHNMQQDMMKMFMSLGFKQEQVVQEEIKAEPELSMPRFLCTNCGRPFNELDEHTMAGCAVCYEAMRAEMGKMLKTEDAHQDAADTVDEEAVEVTDAEIEQDIRFKLMEAVIREDFEEAARLRDLLAPYDHQEEKA